MAKPYNLIAGDVMGPRPHATPRGTVLADREIAGAPVFAGRLVGFALAFRDGATYPARTLDGGRVWRIDGPQFHIDAADAPQAVGYVGVGGPRTFFAYGSSAVM
jgi:hypothetical protein